MEPADALMAFHAEVMPDPQQRMLHTAGPLATRAGFYLAGGTAIAIQLGHRRSVDLDWFTPGTIPDPMRLAADIRDAMDDFAVTGTAEGTLHGQAGGVKFSFLEYRYAALVEPVEWPEYGCHLAGLEDLACMKLSAIGGRGAKKDFIDVYALGRTRFTLDEMLGLYRRKFAVQDVGHILMSLTYFDDADAEDMPEMLWDTDWPNIKRTIEGWISDLVRRPSTKR
jgi:predicted nucleotidyltransferase component of viral defense system